MTAKQIAKALNLSNRTIEAYLVDLKDKLHCENKSDLVAKKPLKWGLEIFSYQLNHIQTPQCI